MRPKSHYTKAERERMRRRAKRGAVPLCLPPWHDTITLHNKIARTADRIPCMHYARIAEICGCSRPLVYKVLGGGSRWLENHTSITKST